MDRFLPFRSRIGNEAAAVSAPAALHLVATRSAGPDRNVVVLRADLSDMTLAASCRHAVLVLEAMVSRFPGHHVDAQILDGFVPLALFTQEGRL